jgi:DNA-binding SARP family transcriptional activator
VTVDRLVHVLWGDAATTASTATLHSHVSRLRRQLTASGAPARLLTDPGGYLLEADTHGLDALLFEDLVRRARDLGAGPEGQRADLLGDALALWHGDAYADVADEDFAQAEAARLEELRVSAAEDRCDALVAAGRHGEAIVELEALVRQHPLRERPRAALMLARYRSGRLAEALEVFSEFRSLLADELGLEPSPALQSLQADVLTQAPHLQAPFVPPQGLAPLGDPPARLPYGRREPAGDGARDRGDALETVPRQATPGPIERKVVTVLVAGLGGSVDRSDDLEEAAEALEPLLAVVVDAVHRYGGAVTALGTASVTAMFGIPRATEDHALSACRAAATALERAADLPGATLTIGVHSGEVLVQDVRTDVASGVGAVGPTVDRAHAARRLADVGTVVLSADTVHLTQGVVEAEPLETGQSTDRTGPTAWCRLRSVAPTTTWEARARFGLSTLTGRERQLTVLDELVDRVGHGRGHVVGIVGEPGVGKSRLVYELARRVPAPWAVLTVVGAALDATTPFGAARQAVVQTLGLPPELSGAATRAALDRSFGVRMEGSAAAATALADLVGLEPDPGAAGDWATLDPAIRRRRTVASVVDLLLESSASRPLLVVVEDAHWLDGESLAVVDSLADRISAAQVLLVVTYRPEFRPTWEHRSNVTVLPLEPLAEPEALALAGGLLGDHPGVAELQGLLARWAGGVPLFIEETVRALADDGTLDGPPGAYRLTQPVARLRLPSRVQGVVAARIDRLRAAEKRLLQAAAVVGVEAPVLLLQDVVEDDPDEVDDALAGLLRSELLFERRRGSERRYVFKHAVVHEAAHASLPRGRRRALHARVVECVRARYPEELDDKLDLLGHHAFEAERWRDAVDLLTTAGERAMHRCAYREAAVLLTRALDAQRRLPPDPAAEIDQLVRMRPALHTLSDFDGALARLDRAEELATATGDRPRLLAVSLHRSYVLDTRGHAAGALEAGEHALELATQLDDPLRMVEARMAIGQALAFSGDPRAAIPLLERDQEVRRSRLRSERLGMGFSRALFASALIAACRATLGEFAEARRAAEEAADLLTPARRLLDVVGIRLAAASIHLERGAPGEAVPVLQTAYDMCTGSGITMIAQWFQPRLGEALARSGRTEEARGHLVESMRAAERHDVPLWRSWALVGLAHAALAEQKPDEARWHADEAATLASRWRYPLTAVASRRLAAAADLASGDLVAAEAGARSALAAADDLGARPEHVRAGLLLSSVLESAGKPAQARETAGRATTEGAAMGLRDLVVAR